MCIKYNTEGNGDILDLLSEKSSKLVYKKILRSVSKDLLLWVDLLIFKIIMTLNYVQLENQFMVTDKLDSGLAEFCEKCKVGGGTLMTVLPGTIEFRRAGCIFYTSLGGPGPRAMMLDIV